MSVNAAAAHVSGRIEMMPLLSVGRLRNIHREIERRAKRDPEFAKILPLALAQHRSMNQLSRRRIGIFWLQPTPEVLRAFGLTIVAQ